MILIVHLRGRIAEAALHADLARWLGLTIPDLAPIERATLSTVVPYRYTPHTRGFLTTIELYAGSTTEPAHGSEKELARYLARQFAQDALISPDGDAQPYHWLLVRPDGTSVPVTEIPAAGDDPEHGIVIAEPAA